MANSAIQHYKEQSVQSMSKGEQIVLLFDEAVKNLKYAVMMLEKNNEETFLKCTQKAKDIFQYLRSVLDMSVPVSSDLYDLYYFFYQEVVRAEITREGKILSDIIPLVSDLRDTWVQANRIVNMNK